MKLTILFLLASVSVFGQVNKNIQYPFVSDNDTVGYYLFSNQMFYKKNNIASEENRISGIFFIKTVSDTFVKTLNQKYKFLFGTPQSLNLYASTGNYKGGIIKDVNGKVLFPMVNNENPISPQQVRENSREFMTSSHLKRAGKSKNASKCVLGLTALIGGSILSSNDPNNPDSNPSKIANPIFAIGGLIALILDLVGNNALVKAGEEMEIEKIKEFEAKNNNSTTHKP